jgi:hypothetical protein
VLILANLQMMSQLMHILKDFEQVSNAISPAEMIETIR